MWLSNKDRKRDIKKIPVRIRIKPIRDEKTKECNESTKIIWNLPEKDGGGKSSRKSRRLWKKDFKWIVKRFKSG